jgi:hypothetical protein
MPDYNQIAKKALLNATKGGNGGTPLNEAVVYPENMSERMHPQLEDELRDDKHSLGKHPAFPEGDEDSFTQKIMGKRFSEVAKRYKRAFDVNNISNEEVKQQMMPLVFETIALESKHKAELEKLAVEMIRKEYDISPDAVEIIAELTPHISIEGTKKNPKPMPVEGMEFENHEEIENTNAEVYKRRLLNAMTQGAAKKCNHMFHMVAEELGDLDPKLPNKYAKMMAAADYMYYIIPKMDNGVSGGVVKVEFPSAKNPKAIIYAQAMVFPVLVHEIVKGVMELLSAHGLPKKKKIAEYVINKADFLAAEPWDMRMGPAIWEQFADAIDADDFDLKHHVYSELAALPAKEFHKVMKEILAGTVEGKKYIKTIVNDVRRDLQEEEFGNALNELGIDTNNDEDEIEPFM